MRMIDLAAGSNQRGTLPHIINNRIIDTSTSVDCVSEQVRFRRSSFRSLVACMVPYCCGFPNFQSSSSSSHSTTTTTTLSSSSSSSSDTDSTTTTTTTTTSTTVTGTFFGYRKGRVSFCLQHDSRSSPLLLLEFAVQTSYLAKEMQHGQLRIALECDDTRKKLGLQLHDDDDLYVLQRRRQNGHVLLGDNGRIRSKSSSSKQQHSLYNVPAWSMYCNGRKVGYAMRRQMTVSDLAVLKLMQSVSVGAGVLPNIIAQAQPQPHQAQPHGDLMYLRASFQRVIGSLHSHSFHMINPAGSSAQELSIFLLRSS